MIFRSSSKLCPSRGAAAAPQNGKRRHQQQEAPTGREHAANRDQGADVVFHVLQDVEAKDGIEALLKDNSGNWFSMTERPKQ